MTFEEILAELRDVVIEGQRVPSYDVADTRTLVVGIERLREQGAVVDAARAWAQAPRLGHEAALPSTRRLLDAVAALEDGR